MRALPAQHGEYGLVKNTHVHGNAPVVDLVEVQQNHALKCHLAPARRLPQAYSHSLYAVTPVDERNAADGRPSAPGLVKNNRLTHGHLIR